MLFGKRKEKPSSDISDPILREHQQEFDLALQREKKIFTWGGVLVAATAAALILADFIYNLREFVPELTQESKYLVLIAGCFAIIIILWGIIVFLKRNFIHATERAYLRLTKKMLDEVMENNKATLQAIVEGRQGISRAASIIEQSPENQRLYKIQTVPDYTRIGSLREIIGQLDIFNDEKGISIKLVTTTRGIMGHNCYNLIHLIKAHLKDDMNFNFFPVREITLVVPGENHNHKDEYKGPDYRLCARLFCLRFLKMVKSLKRTDSSTNHLGFHLFDGANLSPEGSLVCRIRYKFEDIFPTFHLIDDKRLIIFPSLSYELQKEAHSSLTSCFIIDPDMKGSNLEGEDPEQYRKSALGTVRRALEYFDTTLYGKEEPDEVWKLNGRGEFYCERFNSFVIPAMLKDYKEQGSLDKFLDYLQNNRPDYKGNGSERTYSPMKQVSMIKYFNNLPGKEALVGYGELAQQIEDSLKAPSRHLFTGIPDQKIDLLMKWLSHLCEIEI
jgi:hypothetical protein